MFQLTYAANELRRRIGRTIVTALGLAAGVGLVIGIIGVSHGLDQAQASVLAPLRSIGTDILVTRVAGASEEGTDDSPERGPRRDGFFRGDIGPGVRLNDDDLRKVLKENSSSVLTDLSKLGKPGTKFSHDFFLSGTLLSFPDDALDEIEAIDGVSAATPGLTSVVQHQTGTVPKIVANVTVGGETLRQTFTLPRLTAAEQQQMQKCVEKHGGFRRAPGPGAAPGAEPDRNDAFHRCMPEKLRKFEAEVVTPRRQIQQLVNPPRTDMTTASYTAAGVDPMTPRAGLVTTAQLVSGRWIAASAPNEVLVGASYADKKSLRPGSTLTINGTAYEVVGIVNPTLTGSTADVYFPLETLQKLSSKKGRITHALVKVDDAARVETVAAKIREALPGAQVVTTKTLAEQVTGSLKDARNVASRLGGALGAIVLAAAFVIAMLLTLSSIAKRVREIGTLRAIGWSRARVVRQVIAETLGIGLAGGLLGVGLGFAAAWAVGAFSPELTATTAGVLPGSQLSEFLAGARDAVQTTTIALSAPVRPATLALGLGFALFGGLLAGIAGGWRAARLSPAEALRNIG